MGYVFAACANLGVGGAVETWKTVFGKEGIGCCDITCANSTVSTY